jgi:hypothetical protein
VHAQGATCATDPLQALVGTWTFSTQGFAPSTGSDANSFSSTSLSKAAPSTPPFGAAGQFVAGVSTDAEISTDTTKNRVKNKKIGVLSIVSTSASNGASTQLETDGTYEVLPDCSGGTLTFNTPTPIQFDFWFFRGSPGMSFVSKNPGFTITGSATGDKPPDVIFFTCTSSKSSGTDAGMCKCDSTDDCFDLGASGECKAGTFKSTTPGGGTCTYKF